MSTTRIAYLGPEGSYSHRATQLLFDEKTQWMACERFDRIFESVETENCQFGVLPIENNTAGIVDEAIDLLISSKLKICAEYAMPVQHALMSCENSTDLSRIHTLYSMTQPYYQSKQFIDQHLSHANWVQTSSSSQAMKTSQNTPKSAAIGFADSGVQLGLNILAENIQNRSDNTTRFYVLSKGTPYTNKRQAGPTTRSTLVFTLEDKPGSLLSILEIFRDEGINMCHIESRRTPLPEWNYYFFITLETELDCSALEKPLKKVEKLTPWNRFLGKYPVLL